MRWQMYGHVLTFIKIPCFKQAGKDSLSHFVGDEVEM